MPSNTAKKKTKPLARPRSKPAAKPGKKGPTIAAKSRTPVRREAAPPTPPRAMMAFDDDDVLPSGGSMQGLGFGRCGGRMLASHVERKICDLLAREGVAHSHHPRHFEIQVGDGTSAAYAPMIVVRGRGREGKTIVIEAMDRVDPALVDKIRAFRRQYGLEFYVSFVAAEDVLDEIPLDAYDESTEILSLGALVSRLAD